MSYCVRGDLLLGDLALGSIDPDAYINLAAMEIDSALGYLYVTPIALPGVAPFIVNKLKLINLKVASGRILLAMDQGGEENHLHAYGTMLVQEGMGDLEVMATGQMDLPGVALANTNASVDGNGPTILVADAVSGTDAFYEYATNAPLVPVSPGPYQPFWRPGPNPGYGPYYDNTPVPGQRRNTSELSDDELNGR